jgi:hypothetical protein
MGWYEQRRGIEAVFLVLALGGMAVMAAMATRWLRPFFARHPLAGIGAAVLTLHVLIQAAMACHLDKLAGRHVAPRLGGTCLRVERHCVAGD